MICVDRRVGRRHRVDVAPVAHDRDPVGDLLAARPSGARCRRSPTPRAREVADDPEQLVDLGVVQRRGRLVHDQHVGVERQRLGDLDHLLLGDGESRRPASVGRAAGASARTARAACALSASSSRRKPHRRGSRPMKMFCATVRWGIRLSSWWMMLMPSCWAAAGVGDRRRPRRRTRTRPGVGAGRSRRGSSSASTCRRRSRRRARAPRRAADRTAPPSSAWTPGNVLPIPSISTSRSAAGDSVVMLASPLQGWVADRWREKRAGAAARRQRNCYRPRSALSSR